MTMHSDTVLEQARDSGDGRGGGGGEGVGGGEGDRGGSGRWRDAIEHLDFAIRRVVRGVRERPGGVCPHGEDGARGRDGPAEGRLGEEVQVGRRAKEDRAQKVERGGGVAGAVLEAKVEGRGVHEALPGVEGLEVEVELGEGEEGAEGGPEGAALDE